jgi:hypothetical protein
MEARHTRRKPAEGAAVRNRDIPLLERVLYVMQDVRALDESRAWQKDRMSDISQHLTGMPKSGGLPHGLEAAYAALSEVETDHEEEVLRYIRELKAAEKIIRGIGSRLMRTFVCLLYLEHLPPEQVRRELNLTEWGYRRARAAVEQASDMQSVRWRDRYLLVAPEKE